MAHGPAFNLVTLPHVFKQLDALVRLGETQYLECAFPCGPATTGSQLFLNLPNHDLATSHFQINAPNTVV
jgi:hypothetical protein